MDSLLEIAAGAAVATVLFVRYGVLLKGSLLHKLIGWRGYPLWWTPVHNIDDGTRAALPTSDEERRTEEEHPGGRGETHYVVCPPSYPAPAGLVGPPEVPCSSCGRPVMLLNLRSAIRAVPICPDCYLGILAARRTE